eukprot:TRINITY_DN72435_c0_g1_i1.p1 TRINITY_DN72435_c0_g1~~TRINITY_DN72435_c0_g1_i1.p1  ORF type:complete len:172 (+),score=38.36 TRINITY_DN72435_c0_g1_i1:25-540(+)
MSVGAMPVLRPSMAVTLRSLQPRCLAFELSRAASSTAGRRTRAAKAEEDPRTLSFEERGYAARDKRRPQRYWPPPERDLPPLELPGGRKEVRVVAAKSDVDGSLEAQVAIMTRGGHRLFYLSEEELTELEKLAPRISEYFELWEEKKREEEANESTKHLEESLKSRSMLQE